MMYFIVEFGDNTISMVPENWLNKDKTMTKWPPYKDDKRIVLAIDKMELPTSEWGFFDISRVISTADCYEIAVKKLKSAETCSNIDDVFTDLKSRHSRAKVVFTENEILSTQDNANIKNKKKKNNMPSLPKVPSTLSEKCIPPVVSNTSTKQKMKNVKTPVNNKSPIVSTSLFEDWNVEERNKHSLNLSDNEVCKIPEKRKKILLSGNSSKDSGEEENECPTIL